MADDAYKGDLEGVPTPHATSMRCGICLCGDLVGIDLLDVAGRTMAHGHLDLMTAVEFLGELQAACVEAAQALGIDLSDPEGAEDE